MSTRLARSDDANTAVLLTSATPIISAEALDEVRRGDRATLSRARTPGTLNSFATGHPIILVTGLATVDDRLAMPRNSSSAPVPASPTSPTVPPGRTNRPDEEQRDPHDGDDHPGDEPSRPQCGEAELGPHGRHRWDLRRSTSGHDDRQHGDADTDEGGHEDGPWQHDDLGVRESGAGRVEQEDETSSDDEAADETGHRTDDPERECLQRDQAPHLASRGADRAEQGELSEALPDADLEDVVDDERAHERSDEGEHEQSGSEDPDELVDGVGGFLGRLLAGDHLGPRWQDVGDRPLNLPRRRRPRRP